MPRGRKKGQLHPSRECGPCSLCRQHSTHYCHLTTWEADMKERLRHLQNIADDDCICRACERDIKRNITKEGYKPRWLPQVGKGLRHSKCIVSGCTECDTIIHTGLVTKDTVANLLQTEVVREQRHSLTPLCGHHYKQIHRLLHTEDEMSARKKCYTCHAVLQQGTARHCVGILI